MSTSVGEDFPKMQERAREILKLYEELGPVGAFGALQIRLTIKKSEEAMASGDILRILQSYQELKDIKE